MENVAFNYKLSFYIPESHLDTVKEALFAIGAGKQGDYDKACWQCLGQGQFRPLSNANPAIGEVCQLNYVPEYKVEILCSSKIIKKAVQALRDSHPYEEPAYEVVRIENF
ncbi:structural toxin protein (hemagglutinin/hemolysin) RtxA [Legionella beliardensis]|uniref:Structural toxin protein (Hemagglutinin/hemolysin) RtxA n=1 Tax=Legionella beliardensis TaxID=91822 RepID=A0A378I9Z3_9GAMM|nr:NGG1p interacting factor NIF3 [Legionella beliardensis]STX29164.1 structural toxin protein (hemagglutinin/hemolysin) RtxA [Legionella beliardensis]